MPRFWLLGVTWLVACSGAEFQQQRLQDGSLKITCELAMDECMQRAQDLCQNQRFRILDGESETRLRDAPPFERAYHTSRLHLKCTSAGDALLSLTPAASPQASSSAAPAAPSPPPLACTIGETRTCVGPGACQGGQTCLADRTGFGACDCGPAPTPVPVTPSGSSSGPAASPSPPHVAPPPATGASH